MVDAQRVLGDVKDPNQAFWFTNGTIVRNIFELINTLEVCSKDVFEYHVNKEKNDIYNWVLDVLGDPELAGKLKKETSQKKYISKIKKRIIELDNPK